MEKRSNLKIFGSLIVLVKPLAGYMVLAVGMGLLGHLCATFITVAGGYAVLNILGLPVFPGVMAAFVAAGIFALLRGALRYGEQSCNHYIAFRLLALIRDKVFRALRTLAPAKLEGREKGNLISIITSDIELLEVFYAHTISPILIAAGMTILMCIFLGSRHLLYGIIGAVAYLSVGVIVPLAISKRNQDSGMVFRNKSGELSSFVLDSMRGLKETIQYSQGENRLAQMEEKSKSLSQVEEKMKGMAGQNIAITNSVILLFDAILLFCGAWLYQQGKVDFGGVLVPVIALMSSFGPVVALANLGSTLQNTLASANRVLDILEEEPSITEITGKEETGFEQAKASHVNFSYGEETILSDFSIEIPKGKIIGVIGKSGSGKSTFLKLLMRFWKVQKGSLTISGKKLDDINTSDLRNMESFMTQETHLFHDSIASNLRIAKQNASMDELEAACKKASIHDFIKKLPKGYDTMVGELGDTLSGGERQRIGLARAFLHDAPVILLDEPTSNLDSLNEAVILKALKEEKKEKTVLLVSHRQSTMKIAERVYSVESGRTS